MCEHRGYLIEPDNFLAIRGGRRRAGGAPAGVGAWEITRSAISVVRRVRLPLGFSSFGCGVVWCMYCLFHVDDGMSTTG